VSNRLSKLARTDGVLSEPIEYFYFVYREIKNIWTYINAFFIGSLIYLLSDVMILAPYLVPLLVQVVVKSAVQYKSRDLNMLVELPAQKDDPAFIMDHAGEIVLSTGKTRELFESFDVQNIHQFVGEEGLRIILDDVDPTCSETVTVPVEVYSEKTRKWYEAKAKPMVLYCGKPLGKFLVWFQDISYRKTYDLKQQELLQYTGDLVTQVRPLAKKGEALENLAAFILANYEAVFITRKDASSHFLGCVYKMENRTLRRSEPISISEKTLSPVILSRHQSRIVADERNNFASNAAFFEQYPFDGRVLDFIDVPIRNFITYHRGDISIIVFNALSTITPYDKQFMEVVLSLSQSVIALVDLARENDEQFLQKVMGLCAAAEYSDQITGKHILRVNAFSRFLAEKMGFGDEFVDTIGQIASLHDIGKVAIPEIVKLPRRYTEPERLKMQMHTVYGADIIETMMGYASKADPRLTMARNIALHHHQTCNGRGYPMLKRDGRIIEPTSKDYRAYLDNEPLRKSDIPIEGLIVGLADRYDALRSKRQYKPALTHDQVLSVMWRDDLTGITGDEWYGPKLWAAFMENHDHFRQIYDGFREA